MLTRFFRTILPTLLLLEAGFAALWIWNLVPSLAGRGALTLSLVAARALVSAAEMVSFWCLRTGRPFAATLASRTLVAAGVLMTFETGLRLAPGSLDPSFRWHVVVGYWAYVAIAWLALKAR